MLVCSIAKIKKEEVDIGFLFKHILYGANHP